MARSNHLNDLEESMATIRRWRVSKEAKPVEDVGTDLRKVLKKNETRRDQYKTYFSKEGFIVWKQTEQTCDARGSNRCARRKPENLRELVDEVLKMARRCRTCEKCSTVEG